MTGVMMEGGQGGGGAGGGGGDDPNRLKRILEEMERDSRVIESSEPTLDDTLDSDDDGWGRKRLGPNAPKPFRTMGSWKLASARGTLSKNIPVDDDDVFSEGPQGGTKGYGANSGSREGTDGDKQSPGV